MLDIVYVSDTNSMGKMKFKWLKWLIEILIPEAVVRQAFTPNEVYKTKPLKFGDKEEYPEYNVVYDATNVEGELKEGYDGENTLWESMSSNPDAIICDDLTRANPGCSQKIYDRSIIFYEALRRGIQTHVIAPDITMSYAGEIQTPEFGKGLDQIMRMESGKLSGIVNGIDTDLLDPETDTHIPYHFSVDDLSGKAKDKAALQERLGLPVREDVPVIGMVSRLTDQKGFDLVVNELHNILQHDVQIVLLGTGYSDYENSFSWFAHAYPEKMSANITFNLELAQQIYAGCDIFLMPSAFEPCGLSQMMSMRYGTLPVVSEVGGLRDTVEPYNPVTGSGTGFSFGNFSGYWMVQTLEKALDVYENHAEAWKQLQHNAMTRDFSWDTASLAYVDLYKQLV